MPRGEIEGQAQGPRVRMQSQGAREMAVAGGS